ncbi:hypothetical protein [Streptomyces sp. CBMA152]|nr:hypothetical protein [Streptomyces sp. CBMA152]
MAASAAKALTAHAVRDAAARLGEWQSTRGWAEIEDLQDLVLDALPGGGR